MLTPETFKDYLPAMEAWADRELQYDGVPAMGNWIDWKDYSRFPGFDMPPDHYRRKPKTVIRPWTPREAVEFLGWEITNDGTDSAIYEIYEVGFNWLTAGRLGHVAYDGLANNGWRCRKDSNSPWQPCGVVEEAKPATTPQMRTMARSAGFEPIMDMTGSAALNPSDQRAASGAPMQHVVGPSLGAK